MTPEITRLRFGSWFARARAMTSHPVAALTRIQGEYLESAGLRLTAQQAQRLWGLEHSQCVALLQALVDTGFLRQASDGTYVKSQ